MAATAPTPSQPPRSAAPAFLRVAVILLLWLVAFLAFLVAPLLALLLAWLVGLVWLAVRTSSRAPSGGPAVHQFGHGNGDRS